MSGLPRIIRIRESQRGQPVAGFLGEAERLSAGSQNPDIVRGQKGGGAELNNGIQHMLAVVQYKQHLLTRQAGHQRVNKRYTSGRP